MFEAPHRLGQTLSALQELLGSGHVIGIGRELTKAHEELVIGPISELIERLSEPRGEFTLLVPPSIPAVAGPDAVPSAAELRDELGRMAKSDRTGRRDALKELAARHGVSVNALYRLLEDQEREGRKT
jgi:16S rRNA (cytidine1402-2'-O)-methyltransferase